MWLVLEFAMNDTKKTVLVVEDDPSWSSLVQMMLEKENYHVIVLSDGRQALETVKNTPVDLILLDLVMPGMDGQTFAYELEKLGKSNIPVIVVTNLTTVSHQDFITEIVKKGDTSIEDIAAKIKKHLEPKATH